MSPLAVVHQDFTQVSQLRFLSFAVLEQPSVWIAGRLMGVVQPLLTMKIHGRIAGIIWLARGLSLATETLLTRPRFQQGAVDREVLVRQ